MSASRTTRPGSNLVGRGRHDERGSMAVAMTVIMVLGLLTIGVVARTTAGLKGTRQGQDFSGALAVADAGLNDALFRMDQLGKAPATSFCVGASPGCTVAEVPGAPGAEYVAEAIDANTYIVSSKGIVNGQPHAIQATVSRSYTYPYVIFAKTALTFDGNTGNYDPTTGMGPLQTVDETGSVVMMPAPDVATNGQVTCHGSDSPARQHNYYKGGGTNCENGYLKSGNYNPLDPVDSCPAAPNTPTTPCLPAGYSACPAVGGVLAGAVLPGVYRCTEADAVGGTISFPSVFTVGAGTNNDGVVELFIMSTDGSNINVSIAEDDVNLNGDPTKLRVYVQGSGSILEGNGAHAGSFTGVMYAPSANATGNACKADWRGSIVVNTFICNGGPNVKVWYDNRIQSIVASSWSVTDWTEVPSDEVQLLT